MNQKIRKILLFFLFSFLLSLIIPLFTIGLGGGSEKWLSCCESGCSKSPISSKVDNNKKYCCCSDGWTGPYSSNADCNLMCCNDECSSSDVQYRCSGSKIQKRTCGNYDEDPCLDWSSWQNCYDCNNLDTTSYNEQTDVCSWKDYYCSNPKACSSSYCKYSSGSYDCDNYDDLDGSDGIVKESEVTSSSCTVGCKGSNCCDIKQATCNSNYECKHVSSQISNLDELPNYICFRSNDGKWVWNYSAESKETNCNDGYDNDCDGKKDCYDIDCSPEPPNTIVIGKVPTGNYEFGTWTKYDVTVTLNATDDCAVDKTYYCIDTTNTCEPKNIYSGPILVSCPKNHYCIKHVRFYSTDLAGNKEAIKSVEIKIDKVNPEGCIKYEVYYKGKKKDDLNVRNLDTVKFIVNAKDEHSGLKNITIFLKIFKPDGKMEIKTHSCIFNGEQKGECNYSISNLERGSRIFWDANIKDVVSDEIIAPKCDVKYSYPIIVSYAIDCGGEVSINPTSVWYPNKLKERCGAKKFKRSHHRFKKRGKEISVNIYIVEDVFAYAPTNEYCLWFNKDGNGRCFAPYESFNLNTNEIVEIKNITFTNIPIGICIPGSGVIFDLPVLIDSPDVPNGFVFLPSSTKYFNVKWNVNYTKNPRIVGIKCYLNPHNSIDIATGTVDWCSFDEIEKGTCKYYQICKCGGEWPCYQNTSVNTVGTCSVENPTYLPFGINKIYCKYYDPNFEDEVYVWYNHDFLPFNFQIFFPETSLLTVVGSDITINLNIKNTGILNDKYNITVIAPPSVLVTPTNYITPEISKDEISKVSFVIRPLFSFSDKIIFRVCSVYKPEKCEEKTLTLTIKTISLDDPFISFFKSLWDKIFNFSLG